MIDNDVKEMKEVLAHVATGLDDLIEMLSPENDEEPCWGCAYDLAKTLRDAPLKYKSQH